MRLEYPQCWHLHLGGRDGDDLLKSKIYGILYNDKYYLENTAEKRDGWVL